MENNNRSQEDLYKYLPDEIGKLIKEGAKSLGCPKEYLFSSLLAIASTSIGSSARVKIKNGWYEFPSFYIVLVGRPSMKKTPALNLVKKPLEAVQSELRENFKKSMFDYNSLSKKAKEVADEPQEIVAYASDTTIEGLLKYMEVNKVGVSLVVDELSHLFKSLNSYKQNGGDRQYLLQLYNSSQITVTRKGSVGIHIDDPVMSIVGGIQPKMLKEFFAKGEDDGLSQRFLYSFPEQNVKSTFVEDEIDQQTIDDYNNRIIKLYKHSYELAMDGKISEYRVSNEAKNLWVEWLNNLVPNEDNEETLTKSHATCLRISLVFEILNNPSRDDLKISLTSMKGAIEVTNFYLGNYFRIRDEMMKSDNETRADSLLKWIWKNKDKHKKVHGPKIGVSIREMYMSGAGGLKGKYMEAIDLLSLLENEGRGYLFPSESRTFKGNSKSSIFVLNPLKKP